jgi:hypothetical protein
MSVGHHDDEAEEDKFLDNLLAVVPRVLNWPYNSAQKVNRALVRNGFLPPPPASNNLGDLGLKWKNVGNTQPMEGRDLKNSSLAEALKGKTQFTRQEWEGFGIKGLRRIDFVKSGAFYFQPDSRPGGQDDVDEYSEGGEEQLGTRKSRKKVLICIVLYVTLRLISHTACMGIRFVSYDPLYIQIFELTYHKFAPPVAYEISSDSSHIPL